MQKEYYDAVIIGGGHNGLVCSFYLAKAGLKVKVLERRGIVGGAAVTEEFYPGFRNSLTPSSTITSISFCLNRSIPFPSVLLSLSISPITTDFIPACITVEAQEGEVSS